MQSGHFSSRSHSSAQHLEVAFGDNTCNMPSAMVQEVLSTRQLAGSRLRAPQQAFRYIGVTKPGALTGYYARE